MKETTKLPSERNTDAVKKRVLTAAHKHFHKRTDVRAVFEHGHWWVQIGGRNFDVVDAEGQGSVNGFGFEEV